MHVSSTVLYGAAGAASLILVVFVVFSIWSRKFGTRAAEKWATAKGLEVVSVRRRSFVPHWQTLPSRRFQFFYITVRHKDGLNYKAWMRLGSDCTDPEILDVIWDGTEPPA